MPRIVLVCVLIASFAAMAGCGINPVTGAKELQFVSTGQEIEMGRSNYQPAQQSQGGTYLLDPELNRYVQEVGVRLARVSDRADLPYEFTVLNNSVPNAWALPGGKIAVNRGLLTGLDNEAELAAVLGHEIVHAAARHGAKGMERGMLLQAGVAGVGLASSSSKYADMMVGSALLGANLINQRYSREHELEGDYYGMQYMARAGYDPRAAVTLQEKFVKLSANRNSSWLAGLFASHPPSQERVNVNRQTAARLPAGGDTGHQRYQQRIAGLLKDKPAYDAYDDAVAALGKEDIDAADRSIDKALRLQPREALFPGLKGDILFQRRQLRQAADQYQRAIRLNGNYYRFHQQLGLVQAELGDRAAARDSLARANGLLPTAASSYALGMLARREHRPEEARRYLAMAAQSDSAVGLQARNELAALILEQEPEQLIVPALQLMADGSLAILTTNNAPIPLSNVTLQVVLILDRTRKVLERTLVIPGTIDPGDTYREVLPDRIDRQTFPRLHVSYRVLRAVPAPAR
ncbi:MAG: M48 family metalloprotease [Thermodesulfobacteriota bacterium]